MHTQNIESYNNKVKLRIKQVKGVKKQYRKNFLTEYIWIDNNGKNCFTKTLEIIKINF